MSVREGRGSYVDGRFVSDPSGERIESADPARGFEPVFGVSAGLAHVDEAVGAAAAAQPAWAEAGVDERLAALARLRAAYDERVQEMATAIVYETGKPHREALGEARSLGARIGLMKSDGLARVPDLAPAGVKGRARAHAQGVLAVVGPYNYPAHLVNAHVIPALLTGNTVVIKPTEHCPWVGELYAACADAAGLPPGVLNVLHGAGDVGAALTGHPGIHGVLFTGSFRTGQAIARTCLEQPWKIVALEMGGKNAALVLEDADLSQALAAVLQGAYLTAGQRCTATSRVLVERRIADRFLDALAEATRRLVPGDPWLHETAFGPLANRAAFDRFCELRKGASAAGAEVVVPGEAPGGGAFVTPSVHRLAPGVTEAPGYLDEELFGPDLCVETIDDLDHGIARLNDSPYGLSNAVFTASDEKFERVFHRTRSGLLNKNRSTNGASGKLPFGGVNKSGNQRPAGIDAVRYTTFPVAVVEGELGDASVEPAFQSSFTAGEERFSIDLERLVLRHEIEGLLERYRIFIDDVAGSEVHVHLDELRGWRRDGERVSGDMLVAALGEGARVRGRHLVLTAPAPGPERPALLERLESLLSTLAQENPARVLGIPRREVHLPEGGRLSRSDAYLRRFYRGGFVPREKKQPVVDLHRSEGPVLRSVDNPPLAILDAASQISSLGLGYAAGAFLGALDDGRLTRPALANPDTTTQGSAELDDYARWLLEQAGPATRLAHATWAAGGSEANERALDLCRLNGPGGKTVIAFEGSFHGRTLVPLAGTWNEKKRAPFEFEGYRADFVPFPTWDDPRVEPAVTDAWCRAWARGEAPPARDALEQAEIDSLLEVKTRAEQAGDDVCAVIVEPMQSEGGDRYATARFFCGLRLLTRALGVPLVFDEVQTGLGLGGPIFWHTAFRLRDAEGRPDGPDCVTLAKRAQLGVCLAAWADPRPAPAHLLQAVRGHLHGRRILKARPDVTEATVRDRLWRLALDHPGLVENPRNRGWAFAFDLPTAHLAQQVIAQRFYRGFMAYIAGERTVRFRLNPSFGPDPLDRLFRGISEALRLVAEAAPGEDLEEVAAEIAAPAWIEPAKRDRGPGALEVEGPARLDWLLGLPRGPLERVCDSELHHRGQLPDEDVDAALARLSGRDAKDRTPDDLGGALRRRFEGAGAKTDPVGAWEKLTETLGMPPDRLLVEALGARIRVLDPADWALFKGQVVRIENATYEVGRRESEDELRAMVEGEGGLALVAVRRTEEGLRVVGYAFGGPVEQYRADGPRDDVMNGRLNTFYSSNITVSHDARGAGLGARLKRAQLEAVRGLKDDDGRPRYAFLASRNRVGRTAEMGSINRTFGAYEVERYVGNQYGDVTGEAAYLRIPFHRPAVGVLPPLEDRPLDWASSVQMPLGPAPRGVEKLLEKGALTGPIGTKLTLSNWTTPAIVRYAELLRELCPRGLAHTYFTSSQSELVDKGLRCLRVKRPKAQTVIGLARQHVGTATAAARSLSDGLGQAQPFSWFDWPKVPHPAEAGPDAALAGVLSAIQKRGPDDVLAVVVELVGERTGYTLPEGFLNDLAAIRKDTSVPIVAVETASALGRSGDALFWTDRLEARPNMVWWYCGAQLGHVFVDEEHWVPNPLTLISTWDGDEVSALRNRVHLLEARRLIEEEAWARLPAALDDAGLTERRFGRGLWQVFDLGDEDKAAAARGKAREAGLLLGRGLPGRVVVCPPLDVEDDELDRGVSILRDCLA